MDDDYDLLELPTTATTPTPTTSKSSTFKAPFDRNRDDDHRWSFLTSVLATAIASFVVVLALQLNTLAQSSSTWAVDVDHCTCDCWDRAFKGNYGHGGYKHVYFQMTTGTTLLWLWSAAHFVMLLKFVERATVCVLGSCFFRSRPRTPRVRWPVLFLSCINFYGLFYNWWSTFNYINDAGLHEKYHILLPTQLFFDITDIIPAITLYRLLPSDSTITSHPLTLTTSHTRTGTGTGTDSPHVPPTLLFTSLTIGASHLLLSLTDQGLAHLLTLKGAVLRDAMFIISDLAAVLVFTWFLRPRLRRPGARIRLIAATAALSASYLLLKRWAGYSHSY